MLVTDHRSHTAGTASECPECRKIAYEPSWYAKLRALAVGGAVDPNDEVIAVPDSPTVAEPPGLGH